MDRSERTFPDFVVDVEPALLGTAFLLTGRRRDAHDAVVAALAAVHRRWRRLDPATARAEARRVLVADVLSGYGTAPQTVQSDGPEDDVPAADRAWLQALAGLPTRSRAALVLRLHDGLDDDGTAELLGQDLATVAALVDAALDELAPLLEDDVLEHPAMAAPPPAPEEDANAGDPDAPFRRPDVPDPSADPHAAFRRPEPTAPATPRASRPAVTLAPARALDAGEDAIYRRPGTPTRRPSPVAAPAAAPDEDADDDPDAIYRRPQ